jgi:hypothetical protein
VGGGVEESNWGHLSSRRVLGVSFGSLDFTGDGWKAGLEAHAGVLVLSAVTEPWICISLSSYDILLVE